MQIRYVDWHGMDVNCTRKFEMENGIGNAWKEWKSGGCKEEYLKAKILLNQHYILQKKKAQAEQFGNNNSSDKN